MGNISNGMESICQGIVNSSAERKKSLKDVKEETENIREGAQQFVGDCKKSHKEMAKNLKETLNKSKTDLSKDVDSLRKSFRKAQKEVKQDLVAASQAWSELHKAKIKEKTK